MKLPSQPVFLKNISIGLFSKPFQINGSSIKHFSAKFISIFVGNLLLSTISFNKIAKEKFL